MPDRAWDATPDPAHSTEGNTTADPTGPPSEAPPVLVEVVRSGFVEGRHRGAVVLLDRDGAVARAWGRVDVPLFPRSCNKPLQAAAMLRAGVELAGERLALAAASHSGEPFHLRLVRRMLAEHRLSEELLGCPADLPLDQEAAREWLAAGHQPSPVAMNCSGKHTAMLATCGAAGWPVDGYLDPGHPLQRAITDTVERLAGEPVAQVGVDGCGAPLLSLSLTGLARSFRACVLAPEGAPERRVADAARAHPEYVAGSRRHDTWLMRGLPGALAKMGAEGVQAVALPDGRALAFKVEDGARRALGPVLAHALRLMGVTAPVLDRVAEAPVTGGGRPVGALRAVF
ncbi:asparaginase [Streptomyces sp. NPDC005438]|uniref:asparaginase n=1 Tax=Streptomyces sp. NPDC005438 TaxID=3156880 RepID=UPI0033AB9E11